MLYRPLKALFLALVLGMLAFAAAEVAQQALLGWPAAHGAGWEEAGRSAFQALPIGLIATLVLLVLLRRAARRVNVLPRGTRLAWMVPLGAVAGAGLFLVTYLLLGDEVRLLWLPCAIAGAAVGAGLAGPQPKAG